MSDEIKKVNLEDLGNVFGGTIVPGEDGGYEIVDPDNGIGYYKTLEEAKYGMKSR